MKRKQSPSALKNRCWKLFSEYIRRKDADDGGTVECYTCGKLMHWKESQAGHFVAGRGNAVLFNEDCVRVQCQRCNIWLGGNYQLYTLRMLKEIGEKGVNDLLSLRHKPLKLSRQALEDLISHYRGKLKELDHD